MGVAMFQKNLLFAKSGDGDSIWPTSYCLPISDLYHQTIKKPSCSIITNFRPKYSSRNHYKVVKSLFQKLCLQSVNIGIFISWLIIAVNNKYLT